MIEFWHISNTGDNLYKRKDSRWEKEDQLKSLTFRTPVYTVCTDIRTPRFLNEFSVPKYKRWQRGPCLCRDLFVSYKQFNLTNLYQVKYGLLTPICLCTYYEWNTLRKMSVVPLSRDCYRTLLIMIVLGRGGMFDFESFRFTVRISNRSRITVIYDLSLEIHKIMLRYLR